MKSKFIRILATSIVVTATQAAPVTWVGTNTGTWTTTTNWSDSLAPAAGNTYSVSGTGKTITNPDANASTFGGDSLTVTGGAVLRLFRTNGGGNINVTNTIPGLTVDGATIKPASSSGSITQILANQVTLANAVTVEMNDTGGFTNQLTFTNGYTGSGTLTLQRGGTTGSGRNVNINGTNSTSGYSGNVTASGNVSTDTLALNINTTSGWGTGSLTVNQWCTAAFGAAITSTTSALAVNANGIVNLGNFSSSIGSLSGGTGGIVQGTGTSSALTITQTSDTTFAGTLGFTAGNALSFTKNGASNLVFSGTVNPAIPFTLNDGGLGFGTKSISSLTQNGGQLLLNVGTSSADLTTITGAYTCNSGGITIQVGSPPTLNAPYTLLTYGSFSGTNPPVTVTGLSTTRLTSNVTYGANNISVTFSGSPASIKWTGAQPGGVWDINNTQNWDNAGNADKYFEFDTVTFDDNATGTTGVVLDGNATPTAVVFDNDTKNYTLTGTGSIIGAATLTLSGDGVVTLATNNAYTGTTTIQSGTLRIGNGGTIGTLGSGAVTNNGTLVFNRSDALTVANAISGSGSLEQAGTGTSLLTADNSYSGSTTISAGTLQVGSGGATGTLGNTSSITNNGALAFNRSGSLTINSAITGTGSLIQNGPGTVILDNNMAHSGGTTITGGTLQIGNNGIIGSVTGPITDNANLTISRSDDIDFANIIAGSGSVTHGGSGTLRLTGANTYAGNTMVNGGGTLLLDSTGSSIPAGTGITLSSGALDFSDTNLTISSLTKAPSGTASIYAEAGRTLTVSGTGNVLINQGSLGMTGIDSFIYQNASGSFSAITTASGGTASAVMAVSNHITAASFSVGLGGPGGSATSSNTTVDLGDVNVIHADSIVVGSNGAQSGTSTLRGTSGAETSSVTIRGTAGGSARANLTVGYKRDSDYSGGTGVVDISGVNTTLDAMFDSVVIGKHDTGAGNFNNATSGSFSFNAGTLDANSIVMAVGGAPSIKTANGTLTTYGGTIRTGSLTLVQDSGGAMGTATVNVHDGGTLQATTITGQASANAILNIDNGTISDVPGTSLTITGTTLSLTTTSLPALAVESGQTATLGADTVFKYTYNPNTLAHSTLTVTGDLVLSGTSAALLTSETPAAPITAGTKLVLANYAAGTLTGTFTGLADGDTVTVGDQTFTIDYNDPAYAGKAVTLTALAATTPFEDWLTLNGITPGGPNTAPAEDHDADGLANMVEYMLGSDPDAGALANLPVTAKSGSNMTFTFTRLKEAVAAGFSSEVEYSETMAGTWTTATAGMFGTPVDNGTTETITVTIPIPGGADKLFARLKVVEP